MAVETQLRRAIVPENTRILAVDDVDAKRYAWEKVLKRAGFSVESARNGREALDLVRRQPDLVILDMKLPDIDGLEVCRRIKDEPATSSIPVLHVSATLVAPEDRAHALESGADGYLTEPVDPDVLIASVKALLRMRKAEEHARRAAAEWRATFDAIQDGVLVVDARGLITRCNAGFMAITGRLADEIVGRPAKEFFLDEMRLDGALADWGSSRERQTAELAWGSRWVRLTVDPMLNDGVYQGSTCILSDVTERKRVEADLRTGREQLRALNIDLERRVNERTQRLQAAVRELEAFTYTIAHDLRAPLRAMHRFSELLISDYGPRLDEEGRHYADRIIAGAEKMDALIRDLLDYSRLAQSELRPVPLRPSELAADIRRAMESHAPAEFEIDPDIPEVVADRVLLSQVLLNLMGNAVKFVAPGTTPKVKVSGERREGNIVLSVVDNGIGIPAASRNKLFKVFERLGGAKDYPGTGIGLAIVRRAVDRMGGTYGVESEPGKGSRFWISLPAAPGGAA